ncbi:MAG: TRIC cation channel family protein [Formivibrio sp.]|nr:TRIC cation channel family protein [Formivibrio sp.]
MGNTVVSPVIILALLFGFSASLHMSRFIWIADAASLSLFSVARVSRALNSGLPILAALILGLITAVGGGSLRDVLMGRTPRVFERGEPYAIAALLAVLVFLACDRLGLDRSISTTAGAVSGLVLKLLAARFHWKTPAMRFRMEAP